MAGFKIATGVVEILVDYDQRKLQKDADRAGKDAGTRFSRSFSGETRNVLSGFGKNTGTFTKIGDAAGKSFADSFGKSFQKTLPTYLKTEVITKTLSKDIDRTGTDLGKNFAESFGRGFEKSMPKLSVSGSGFSESGRAAGRAYASGFQEGVSGVSLRPLEDRVRATRDRIGSEGGNTGNRFTRALSRTLVRGGTESMDGFRRLMSKSLDMTVGSLLLILGGLAVAAPAIGAAMAAGITLAFGGGIATLGVIAAAQSDRVQNAFSRMSDNIGRDMRAMAVPLEGMLVSLAGQIETTFNKLSPALSRAFESAAPVMQEFNRQFLSAFGDWGPVIDRASGAFNGLLGALGPMLRESLGELGDGFVRLFGIVESNPEPFASIIDNIVDLGTKIVGFIADLSEFYVRITSSQEWDSFKANMAPVADLLREMGEDILPIAEQAVKDLLSAFGSDSQDLKDTEEDVRSLTDAWNGFIAAFSTADAGFRKFSDAWFGSADWFYENVTQPIRDEVTGSFFSKDWWAQEWQTFGSNLSAIGSALNPFNNLNIGSQISSALTSSGLSGKLTNWWNTEWNLFKSQVGEIGSWFAQKFESVRSTVSGIWNGIAGAIRSVVGSVVSWVRNTFSSWVGWIYEKFNALRTNARNIWSGFTGAIRGVVSVVVNWVKNTFSSWVGWIYEKFNALRTNAANIWNGFTSRVRSIVGAVVSWVRNTFSSWVGWIYEKFNALRTNAANIWNGFTRAVRSIVGAVVSWVRNTFSSWVGWIYEKFNALRTNAANIWNSFTRAVRSIVAAVVNWVRNTFSSWVGWIYNKFNALRTNAANIWNALTARVRAIVAAVVNWVRNTFTSWVGWIYNKFNALKTNSVNIWNNFKNSIVDKVQELKDKAVNKITEFKDGFIDAFERTRDGVEEVWNKIKEKAAEPVNFMINSVYNDGIRILWSKIADHVPGLGYLESVAPIKFATGGVMPGYTPGRDVHTVPGPNGPVGLSGGEAVMRPEWTRAIGADNVHRMNAAARSGGVSGVRRALGIGEGFAAGGVATSGDVSRNIRKGNFGEKTPVLAPGEGFALGGIVGEWARNTFNNVKEFTQDKLGNIVGWATKPFKDAFNALKGGDSGGTDKKIFPGVPYHAGQRLWEKIKSLFQSKDDAHNSSGSNWTGATGTLKAAVDFAKSQHGKKYQWGGNGNPSWDCSGYLSAIESVIRGQKPHRRWSTHAFGSRGPSGWEKDLDSPFMVGITHRGVGHTAGTLMGNKVESAGGGKGVRFNNGALGHDSGKFQARYGFHPAISKAKRSGGGGSGNTMMTSFWDSHTPMANGKRMHANAIASSVIPLGTKLQVKVGGKTATGSVDDLGPASFVYRRHHPKALLDLAEPMMQKLTGRRSNTVNGSFNVLKRGSGRTLFGYTNWNGQFSPGRSTRGFTTGGVVGGTPMGRGSHDVGGLLPDRHVAHNRSGEAEMVTTLDQLRSIVAAQQHAGDTINFYGDLTIDCKDLDDMRGVVKMVKGLRQSARANGGNVRFETRRN